MPDFFFFFSSRRRHTRLQGDWSSDVCSSDLFAIASSVDTHAHVFERGLPMPDARRYAPDEDALLGTYLHHLDTHGVAHGVLVQPSFLGTDNSYLLQALRAQPQRLRGVAVVDESTGDEQLQALADAGVVGMRLNLIGLPLPDLNAPGWRRVLEQANTLGWHVELHLQAGRLPDLLPALLAAGCRVVVDHFGRPDPALGVRDPGFGYLLQQAGSGDRKSTRLNSSHLVISYAVFCLKK